MPVVRTTASVTIGTMGGRNNRHMLGLSTMSATNIVLCLGVIATWIMLEMWLIMDAIEQVYLEERGPDNVTRNIN